MLALKSNIYSILLMTFLVTFLSACGGGDSVSHNDEIQVSTPTPTTVENDGNTNSEENVPVTVAPVPILDSDSDTTAPVIPITESPNDEQPIPALSEVEIINYLTLINNARSVARSCGGTGNFPAVPAVAWSDKLYKAAYEHSQDLSRSDTFSHDGSGTASDWSGFALGKKSTMADRVATYHYSWSWLSENISAGTARDNPQQAVDSWLESSGHCQNIMSANVTEVGMAVSINPNSKYTNYWTQNFSKP